MSTRERNAARLERVAAKLKGLKSVADDGSGSGDGADMSVGEHLPHLSASEHPTVELTQEITREAVAGLHKKVAKLSAMNAELEIAAAQVVEDRTRPALLDPKIIRQSRFRDRVEEAFRDKAFAQLKRDIQRTNGNVEAIKVRPIADPTHTYEVVFGHRRHAACLELGIPVRAEIQSMDQRQMLLQMWAENQSREDLSLLEQSVSLQRMLDEGVFPSRNALKAHIDISTSALSKLLAISDVAEIAALILKDPRDLTARIAAILRARLHDDSPIVGELIARAKESGGLSLSQLRDSLSPPPPFWRAVFLWWQRRDTARRTATQRLCDADDPSAPFEG